MKFGLYVFEGVMSSFALRILDGEARKVDMDEIRGKVSTPSEMWTALVNAQGVPLEKYSANDPRWKLLYSSRAVAHFFYGVPDDVELYGINE